MSSNLVKNHFGIAIIIFELTLALEEFEKREQINAIFALKR